MGGRLRVLVVDDQENLAFAVGLALTAAGYDVSVQTGVQGAERAAAAFLPDLALLDIRLAGEENGLELARRLRSIKPVPVIFLTASDSVEERLAGFNAGADDYVAKPFFMAELLARVSAVLSRSTTDSPGVLRVADLLIDRAGYSVARDGNPIELRPLEFRLLCTLAAAAGRVLSKSQLLSAAWAGAGGSPMAANAVEIQVSSLRRKLERYGPRLIHTVRGVGYVVHA